MREVWLGLEGRVLGFGGHQHVYVLGVFRWRRWRDVFVDFFLSIVLASCKELKNQLPCSAFNKVEWT